MRLTAAYYRSSTKLQEESVSTQQYEINQYAMKKGLLIDVEYPEPYTSARKLKLNERPKMKQLMMDIHQNKIERILIYKRDRLARKLEEHLELYQLFKKYQVEVLFIADNEPPMRFDVFGELTELFIAVMNQREGEQITSRIVDTKINNFLQGKTIGNLPFGYYTDDAKTEILKNDDELALVKIVFNEWNTDRYKNTQELADEMNEKGKLRRGKVWTSGNIMGILTNPMYMGLRVATFDNKQISKSVKNLAVISKEDFKNAQDIIERHKTPRNKQEKFNYLLSELIHCQSCKEENTFKKSGEEAVPTKLTESTRMKNGQRYASYECKRHKTIFPQVEMEDQVYQKAKAFFCHLLETNFAELYQSHLKRELKQLDMLERTFTNALENAENDLMNATSKWITNDTEAKKKTCLDKSSEVKQWKQRLHDLESKRHQFLEVPNFVKEIEKEFLTEKKWNQMKFEERQELIRDVVHEVNADEIAIQIVFKHPFLEFNGVKS